MKILADATIPELAAFFPPPFILTRYKNHEQLQAQLSTHDILLCRSTLKVTEKLLANSTIRCVATATSGVDHIDCDYLKKQHIPLFDAKGSNARSVADYVVACLAYLARQKKLHGHKAGVIGVGEVGTRVAVRLQAAGFEVARFDPLRATHDPRFVSCSWAELTTCDLVCIHANLHTTLPYPTHNLLNADFFAQCKAHVVIINAARGGIIDEEALLTTLTPLTYCTDVYESEPAIHTRIVDKATLCTPHIAGHSIEAKRLAVENISQQLHRYYHLALPPLRTTNDEHPMAMHPQSHWYETIASLYNPQIETNALKIARDKKTAFLEQRTAHTHRHHFTAYDASHCDLQTQRLLGHTSVAGSNKEKE